MLNYLENRCDYVWQKYNYKYYRYEIQMNQVWLQMPKIKDI